MLHACLNVTMASNQDFSPIPLVGLYIAAASMVCFFLILGDVCAGFRHRKYWFPCRFFSINSVTLTLISVAAKIPVDLTTNMPRREDQLSKLFGTVFVCVTMCFMLPSVATNAKFESYANVTALSIFVITVVANVCIQMGTGVIFNFIPEHIISLIFMLFVLLRFWIAISNMNVYKSDYADVSKDLIRNGNGNMVARLKCCYLYGYHFCPQLYACRHHSMGDAGAVCVMCLVLVVQATLRSFILKDLRFCEGTSDYGWSMWSVVLSQGLVLLAVTFAMGSRLLFAALHIVDIFKGQEETEGNYTSMGPKEIEGNEIYLQFQYLLSLRNLPSFAEKSIRYALFLPLFLTNIVITVFSFYLHLLAAFVYYILRNLLLGHPGCPKTTDENSTELMDLLKSHDVTCFDWALQKGVADMGRCMEKHKNAPLRYLNVLLSRLTPSQELSYQVGPKGAGVRISLLSMKLLVEMSKKVVTPVADRKISLSNVLDEVFEIILFVDNRVNTGSFKDRLHTMLASVIHQYGLTTGAEEFFVEKYEDLQNDKVNFKFVRKQICGICNVEGRVEKCLDDATEQVSNFISYQREEKSEDVYCRIEQIFVDMLHAFLSQLPVAVFTHMQEGPVEEYQERVRLGLCFISKLRSMESLVTFSLPSGSNITSLFSAETPATPTPVENQEQGINTRSHNNSPAVEVFVEIEEAQTS